MLLSAVALLAAPVAPAKVNPVDPKSLTPTQEQQRATELITHFIDRYHYRKRKLDDELSGQIFDRYLSSLDPNRSYFLASDIENFNQYKNKLDNALRDAKLDPAFLIFRRLRERLEERVKYADLLLKKGFDFSVNESYSPDRSEAAWARDEQELNEIWRKRVKNDALTLKLAGKTPEEITRALSGRYRQLSARISQFTSDDIYQAFINAYTASIEPHTSYLSRRTSDNFRIRMSLSLEGIGAALQTDNEYTVVRRVIPGGPADKSGLLHTNDRITGVGQGSEALVDVVGWRLADVVDLIRGPKNTVVRLEVLPKGSPPDGRTRTISLVRNTIKLEEQAAQKSVIKVSTAQGTANIGVIKVPTFYTDFEARESGKRDFRSTTRDVRRLLKELQSDSVTGIIIDLRGNGGGSLAEATELSGLFIPSGPIVQVRDSSGRVNVNEDPDPGIAYSGPLAVLVDRHSASASEIFAGAIQDYRRGVIIGEPTFGKGTVQRLIDLSRFARNGDAQLGQLKFTVAQFFRVNGDSTQHRGVVPDFLYPTVMDGTAQGERALENALPWAAVQPVKYSAQSINSRVIEQVRTRHIARIQKDAGFRYLLAEAEADKEARDQKTVSLLESDRKRSRAETDRKSLKRINEFRSARGLPVLQKVSHNDESELEDEKEQEQREKDKDDILRREAAHILIDITDLSQRQRLMTQRP